MKLYIATLSVCLASILVSCTRIQETNVDFGSKTFVNEYKTLTDAVNDLRVAVTSQTTSLELKLAAIETAIQAQTVEVKAGDELIKTAIETLDASVKAGTVSEQEALEQIKAAMDSQTSALGTKLAAISATAETGFASLVAAEGLIKDAIAALDESIQAGTLSEAEALAQIQSAIQSQSTDFCTKLAAIEAAIQAQTIEIKAGDELIKTAIETLDASVKAGTLSEEKALGQLRAAVESQTSTLSTKLSAIEAANAIGFADIVTAEGLVRSAISSLSSNVRNGFITEKEALNQIKQAEENQTTTLETKLAALDATIKDQTISLKSKLDVIAYVIEHKIVEVDFSTVTTAINALNDLVAAGNASEEFRLCQLIEAFNENNKKLEAISNALAGATSTGSSPTVLGALNNINAALTKSLADGGLYFEGATTGGKQNSMYMSPEAWGSIMASGNQDMKNSVMDALNVKVPSITAIQVQSTSTTSYSVLSSNMNLNSVHSYTIYSVDSAGNATESTGGNNAGHLKVEYKGPDGSAHLYSNMLQGTVSGVANGKPVVNVYKVCDYLRFEVYVCASGCGTQKIQNIITNAAGGEYNINSSHSLVISGSSFNTDQGKVTFKLPCYSFDAATGVLDVLIDKTNFFVLCN